MQRPILITTEKKDFTNETLVLIIDKTGVIGESLAKKLSEELKVVYASAKFNHSNSNITQVFYGREFPKIPKDYYSHIFIIADGTKITRETLPKFIEKAEKDGSELILLTHILELNQKPMLNLINNPKNSKIIIYGDIFSNEKIYDYKTSQFVINEFMDQAQRFNAIKISGDGLKKTYPVFLEDVIRGMLEVVFGSNNLSSIFYLFPKHAPTEISLAQMISKANPNVAIDFIKEKTRAKPNIIFPKGKYLLNDNYNLARRIRKIFLEESENQRNKGNEYFQNKKNNYNFLPLVGFFYLIFILLLPLISTLFFSFLGFKTVGMGLKEISRVKLINAQRLLNLSKTYFALAQKTSQPLIIEASVIGQEKSILPITKNIMKGKDMSQAELYFIESLNKFSKVFRNQTKNPQNDFMEGEVLLKNSIITFQKIQAENGGIEEFDRLIKLLSGAIDVLPNILGFEGPKTYLILFQNNSLLRPTGGLIESFGLLTVDAGIVKDFSIYKSLDIDRQLKGHVEPPYPIRRYLQRPHWYLRDSNFNVDFLKSASKSAYFLDVETNKKADGVLAVDISFLKNLTAKKPVYLTDYQQLVNKNNLLNIFQKDNSIFSFAKIVSDALAEKHLLFAFANPSIQNFFTVNNWSDSLWGIPSGIPLWDKRTQKEGVINDFVGINEANLGENENLNVQRKVSEKLTLQNEKVFGELSIVYNNKGNRSLPNGDYKNYLRIILKKDAQLLSISINGLDQPIVKAITDPKIYEAKKFIAPYGIEVEKTEEEGKTIYGFLVNVLSKQKQTINIKYALTQKISLQDSISYSLYYFKQPGTDEYPFDFTLSYPKDYHLINSSKDFLEEKGKVFISKKLKTDEEIKINLAKD